jgi:Arc/MetJ-type ribon-helix-helix transcriptional regulator
MNLNLSDETVAWLKAQVQSGHFASYEDAIYYTVKLTSGLSHSK